MNIETGQLIRLQIPVRARTLWLSPAWAVVCGIITSSAFVWTGRDVLIAALALVLVDGAWATVWWGLVDTDWRSLFATWDTFDVTRVEATWGATGSSAARSQRGLARLRLWWQAIGKEHAGSPILSALFSVVLAFLLSVVIGGAAVGLTLAALALAQIGLILRVHGRAVNWLHGFVDVGLAWLLGHVAFGQLTLLSALTALIFSFSYAAMLDVAQSGDAHAPLADSAIDHGHGVGVAATTPRGPGAVRHVDRASVARDGAARSGFCAHRANLADAVHADCRAGYSLTLADAR